MHKKDLPCRAWRSYPLAILHPPEHRINATTTVCELANESTAKNVAPSLKRVAEQTQLQPGTHSGVLEHSQRSGLVISEPLPHCAARSQLAAARRVADTTLGQAFYNLMTDMSKKVIHVPKRTVVDWAPDPPNDLAITKISLVDFEDSTLKDRPGKSLNDEKNVIAAVYYRPTIDRDIRMQRRHIVEKTDSERLTQNNEDESYLSD